jgi:hypothetical protein
MSIQKFDSGAGNWKEGYSGAGRVNLYDAGGNIISSVAGVSGDNYLQTSVIQDIHISTPNSSTANLGAGATFTGTSESNLGVAYIQIMLWADQNCTVQLQQSADGSNWDFITTYKTQASFGDTRTIGAAGSYYRVLVTNNGGSTTTRINLQTALTPIGNPGSSLGGIAIDTLRAPTYAASYTGVVVAGPTLTLKGSSTKIIKVKLAGFSATAATGAAVNVTVQKLSGLSGGTPATPAMVPMDSRDVAATATAQSWGGGVPTPVAIGAVRSCRYEIVTAAVGVNPQIVEWRFGDAFGNESLRLRGVAEWLSIDFSAAATTPAANVWMEWTEE